MRYFALLALLISTINTSFALVDAGEKTGVEVSYCSAYDPTDCGSSGCHCGLTRDNDYDSPTSRWSCKYDLIEKDCKVCYTFGEPQDIKKLGVSFYKGDKRKRTITLKLDNTNGVDDKTYEFTSSGDSTSYEYFKLSSDETKKLCIEAEDLESSEWLSIKEVVFLVEE